MRTQTAAWRRPLPRVLLVVLAAALTTGVTACGGSFPADPDGTLETIRTNRTIRVGASHHPPQVSQPTEKDASPTGSEVDLVTGYARHLGASVEWTVDSETALVEQLEEGQLDLVIAGLQADSVWADRAGLTRPYVEEEEPDGSSVPRVIATPAGENALLSDLERWLDSQQAAH